MRTLPWLIPILFLVAAPAADAATKKTAAKKKATPVAAATLKAPAAKGEAPAAASKPADSATPAATAGPEDLGPEPPASSSPMAELKKTHQELTRLLAKKPPSWSPETEAQQGEVKKLVGSFLDYEELARRSLARHWETITPKQRQEFVSVLRDLVERNYVKQIHGSPNYDLKFIKESKTGREAAVVSVLNTVSRGKKVKIDMEYKLLYKRGHWLVYDVITDDQSLLENYRAEFNKIITKESFDALLTRMKKKLNEKSG